jgi:acyl carrier protein
MENRRLMMDNEIESVLWDFLRENCLPQKGEIDLQTTDNLFNSGIIDSAGLIHFVCFIEKKFDIIIPDEDLIPDKFTTIESITNYIRSRIPVYETQN